jgi:hypothetical protein
MKSKLSNFFSIFVGALALLIFSYTLLQSIPTSAQTSFLGNLPRGYRAYPGQLELSASCSCSGVISGASEPLPRCGTTTFCYGNSYTQYAQISTTVPGINSTYCDQLKQERRLGFPCFQLDGDDAIVISGSMSPIERNFTYYSFAFYQTYTDDPRFPDDYTTTRSSANLGVNNRTLKTGLQGRYILIVTANTNTLNTVKNALKATGVPERVINSYLVPASMTNVGSSNKPDQLSLLLRITFQSDEEKQRLLTFVKQTAPNTKVAFIKGPRITGNVTFDNLPKWENTLRVNSTEYDTGLDQKLVSLEQSVTNSYSQKGYRLKARLVENLFHLNPDKCRSDPSNCGYDSPDALYSLFPCRFSPSPSLGNLSCNIKIGPNSSDELMLLGVNHSTVGDKTLASFISKESNPAPGSRDGTFTIAGLYTQGSANQYLGAANAANLYAVKIARNCGSELYCATLSNKAGADATAEKIGFSVLGRAYLDKVTGSAPNPANLVPSVLLWFTKSPPAQ